MINQGGTAENRPWERKASFRGGFYDPCKLGGNTNDAYEKSNEDDRYLFHGCHHDGRVLRLRRKDRRRGVFRREECGEDVEAYMSATATPGGMNELAWNEIKKVSGYKIWVESLEKIGKRYDL